MCLKSKIIFLTFERQAVVDNNLIDHIYRHIFL